MGVEPAEPSASEVAALADYGPAPRSIVGSIPYAVLVFTRRRALQRALADVRRLSVSAQEDTRAALADLGGTLHAMAGAPELQPWSSVLARCDEARRVAEEKNEERQRALQAAETQRASFTAKLAQAEKAAGPYQDRETRLSIQMDVRQNDLRRARARLQRVEIELRNLEASGRPDPGKQQLLHAEQLARRADVAKAQGHVDELAPQLAEARRELAVMREAVNDLERQRRAVDAAQTRTERLHLSTAGEAEQRYRDALTELAEQTLASTVASDLAPDQTRTAERMIAAQRAREHEVKLYEAALRAYDPAAFQKGAAILCTVGILISAMLLLAALR